MQALVFKENNEIFQVGEVKKGVFSNDTTRESYRVITKYGDVFYAVTEGFVDYDVDSVPEDFEPNKYCYTEEKGFYINPNYAEPNDNAETLNELRNLITEFHDDAKITDSDYDDAIALIDKITL